MSPYIVTLIAVSITSKRLRPPAAAGHPVVQGSTGLTRTMADQPIDWEALRAAALGAAEHAYAPYSQFKVGAAALVDDGRIITGCNVENASYGLTLCAECALVGQLHLGGGGRLIAVVTVGNGAPAMPCGRCRQLIWEHGGPQCLVDGSGTPLPMSDVLPLAFPDDGSRFMPPSGR